ncbi:hypothetical protein [Acinetobacter defluvii]|uniref:hypothetical protein n=1 Tax=Acinetobacter defluvii TaxID=1871111 RepID=UPI003AF4D88E
MATDVDVQYFSHLNGLVLGNNWGDLIRLLDKTLVTGIDFTEITQATIDEQGDVHITLYSAHNALLFQIVELSGFTPDSLNQKYRIKGAPSATELILKLSTVITEKNVNTKGIGKLASLGYEIIFRDTGDVKRVYRAKNPRAEHPFIRVDESLTSPDGTSGVYTSSYAKSAMVGLLENMTHIDDYENPEILQLPYDPNNPAKNWKITGTGASVVRGWSRWYWAKAWGSLPDNSIPATLGRQFTICGDFDAFYILRSIDPSYQSFKTLLGCGLFESSLDKSVIPNWFLITRSLDVSAATPYYYNDMPDGSPLMRDESFGVFYTPKYSLISQLSETVKSTAIQPDFMSGYSGKFSNTQIASMTIPFFDSDAKLRGSLKHICYLGGKINIEHTHAIISSSSMYVIDTAYTFNNIDRVGAFNFYLGELE